jgi:PAS domain S-box-containing protein
MQRKSKSNTFKDNFQELLNFVSDSIMVFNQEGVVLAANKTASILLGLASEELIGNHIEDLKIIDEKTKVFVKNQLQKRINGEKIDNNEIPVLVNGETRYFEPKGNRIDYFGEPADLIILRDITEKRQIQGQLLVKIAKMDEQCQETEKKYKKLFQQSKDAMILVNEKTKVTCWNPAAEKTFGYRSKEAIGKDIHKLVVPNTICKEGKERISSSVKMFTETGTGYFTFGNVELVGRRKDGTEFPAELSISPIKLCGKWNAVGVVKDITERKQLEDELRASEERFRAISTSAMDAIILVDEEDKVIYWNPAAEKTFGFTETEAAGKKLSELVIPPLGRKNHEALLNELRHNSFSKKHFDLTSLRKDGTGFPIDLSVASVKLKDKNCIVAIVRDISEQKQMEASIKQERDMLEDITKSIGAGLVIVDKDYHILWTNNFTKNLSGDVTNQVCYSTFNTLETMCPGCGPEKVFAGASFDSREYFNKTMHEKGLPYWYELIATPIKDAEGKITAALELTVDITEKKQLQEKLEEEKNKFEAVTQNISAGLMLVNKDYKITWINQHVKKMFGNIEGKTCYETIHGNNSICPACGVKKIFDGANIDKRETTVESHGDTLCFEVTDTPMKDQEGNVVAVLELAVDITKIKHMQSELSKYSERLEDLVEKRTALLKQAQARLVKTERLATIGELAGMVGHDLRNPLSGIKNSAYYLKKKGAEISEAQAKEMLDTIDKCVDYSNKIVSDLLDYSREIHLELMERSPRALLLESLAMSQVPEKVKIVNCLKNNPNLKVDSDKIKRVFINLIKNAVDAMPNGGKLTIDSKQINDVLELSFSDTGTGISDEVMPKLFSPLFTTKAQGMGFGLAICKRLIEAHAGTISVKTAKGKGTTFIVTLPIEPKPEIGGEKIWINMPKSSLSTTTKT